MKKRSTIILWFIFLFFLTGIIPMARARDTAFWAEGQGNASERFQLAKRSTPELIAFVRSMPKGGDLHIHAGGSSYSEFIIEQAGKHGLNYNKRLYTFTRESTEKEDIISLDALKRNPQFLSAFLNRASMRGWFPATMNGHDHFFAAFNYIRGGLVDLAPLIVEIVHRNRYQNLQYMEIMTPCVPYSLVGEIHSALTAFDTADLEAAYKLIKPHIAIKKAKPAIKAYLDERDKKLMAALKESAPRTGNEGDLVFRYIQPVMRISPAKMFFIQAVVGMLATKTDPRVVAINMLAPEDLPASRLQFEDQMKILDFLWHKMGQPKITLHAGELVLRDSPVEAMRNRIRTTIEKGHAQRFGHGVSIAWEDDVVGLLEKMKNRGIMLELCLSSNESILGVTGRDHPFMLYRRAGVPMCINTDDEGISRSNITMEFVKAIQNFDLSYADVKELIRNSLEYSFLSGKSLYANQNYGTPVPGFEGVRSADWKPGKKATELMKKNHKLNRQVLLERAFVQFEKRLQTGFREK